MITVHRWTGLETKLLREALRLSVRGFAEHLGVGMRTINKWEARLATITLRPHMHEILDTALALAPDEAQGSPRCWSPLRNIECALREAITDFQRHAVVADLRT